MKFFVAGATGYTGSAFVPLAQEHGHQVIAHVRPGSSSLKDARKGFEASGAMIDVTPWEDAEIASAIDRHQPDVVCCFIGTTRERMKQLEAQGKDGAAASYEAVDFGLTDMLVKACGQADLERAPLFVYISAMGVSKSGLNAYMKARWKAEQSIQSSGLPHLIVRPGFISGEDRQEDRPMERIGATLNDALFKTLGVLGAKRLERTYRSMDADELSTAILELAVELAPQRRSRIVEAHDLKRR